MDSPGGQARAGLTPGADHRRLSGQALGLHSAGLLTMQAVAALVAGALAQWVPVATAMVIMAMLSLLVTAYLTPRLRRPIEMERTRVGV